MILTLDKQLWRGKARWTHEERQGPDYEMYNNTPMFRYNSYFGIHTVHYMDLIETYGREKLPMARLITASILTMAARSGAGTDREERILTPWAVNMFNSLSSLKFMSYVGRDGFPVIFPLIQAQTPDSGRLVFSPLAYGQELKALEAGTKTAAFGLTMDMEDLLVRGTFIGFERSRAVKLGLMDIDWVYNSMPPTQGQIYPVTELKPVVF